MLKKNIFNNLDLSFLGDYENARQHIDIHLVDQSKKETVDDAFAKQDCGLFTATYRIVLEDDEEGRYFIAVTKEILKGWDVNLEQMHEDALANQAICIYELKNEITDMEMDEVNKNIKKVSEDQLKDKGNERKPVYILTNESAMDGSSLILNSRIMNDLCAVWGRKVYILPYSSSHSVVIPSGDKAKELAIEIKNIICDKVSEEERLTDRIFTYSIGKGLEPYDI